MIYSGIVNLEWNMLIIVRTQHTDIQQVITYLQIQNSNMSSNDT
jgi:hypothetical protein